MAGSAESRPPIRLARGPRDRSCSYRAEGDLHRAEVTQLSTGGVTLVTDAPLPAGASLVLRIPPAADGSGTRIEVEGRVTWIGRRSEVAVRRPGMGVRFTNLDSEAIESISELYTGEVRRENLYIGSGREA